jgi:magnesium transporter
MTWEALDAPPQVVFETAAEHLTSRVPIAAPTARAGEIRRSLEGRAFDTVAEIAVCEDGKLVGLLNVEDVLAAPEETLASQIMDPDPPVVAPGLDQELAAWKAVQHGESSLAVVDAAGRFVGLIPPSRLLAVLLSEHDEDMARLGGFLRDTASARSAGQEAVRRRIVHRLPWLLLGLAGAFVAADIVATFEEQLQGRVMLAFFLPGVVYLADAVGTQTEALVIRGLSVGVPIGRVVFRELLTGLLMGLALALAFAPVALWRWGQPDVVLAVALSLLSACSIATVIATSLPWLLRRLGLDPAFGSGPLATVVQDLLSILLYFLISVAIVGKGA